MVTLWMTLSCGRREGTLIQGRIEHIDSSYIIATYLSSDSLVIDTIQVDDKGRFSYATNPDTLTAYSLYLNHFESAVVVFAGRDERIMVKGDASLPDLIAVKGNQVNDGLTLFKSENEDLLKQRAHLLGNLSLSSELDSGTHYSRSLQEELLKLNVLNHELSLRAEETIKANPAEMFSLILINSFFVQSDNPVALERVLGYMQGDVMKTPLAARLQSYLEKVKRSAEGASMPYFTLTDKDDKEIYSHDFRGKYLLLSFISTAGIESRETVALLKSEYAKVNKDSVAFITVYIDSDIYPINDPGNDSIPWIVVPEKKSWGSEIVETFNVQFIPFNMLIAPDGIIKVRNVPAQEVVDVIGDSSGN